MPAIAGLHMHLTHNVVYAFTMERCPTCQLVRLGGCSITCQHVAHCGLVLGCLWDMWSMQCLPAVGLGTRSISERCGCHTLHLVCGTTAFCQTTHRQYVTHMLWYCYVVCEFIKQAVSILVFKLPTCQLILQTLTMLVAVLSFSPHMRLRAEKRC
jgi:hypothetical protein